MVINQTTGGAAQAIIELYQQIPSKLIGTTYVPDYGLCLTIGENSTITSTTSTDISFLMEDNVIFLNQVQWIQQKYHLSNNWKYTSIIFYLKKLEMQFLLQ